MWAVLGIVAAILLGLVGLVIGALPVAIILFAIALALAAYAIFIGGVVAAHATHGEGATPDSASADAPDHPWDVEDATRASREQIVAHGGAAEPPPHADRV